jgi:hypothetical protein
MDQESEALPSPDGRKDDGPVSKRTKPPRPTPSAGTVPAKRSSAPEALAHLDPPALLRNHRLQGILIFSFAFLLYANTLGHQ